MGKRFPKIYFENTSKKVRFNPLGIKKINHSKKRWVQGTPNLPRGVIRELSPEHRKEYEDSFPVHMVVYDTKNSQARARIGI